MNDRHYIARSVSTDLGGAFYVRGGPFTREQRMGWHITDERGFTVGVSCCADFVKRATATSLRVEIPDSQFRLEGHFPAAHALALDVDKRRAIEAELATAGRRIAAILRGES